jgi:hypothetical protein
LPLRAQRVSSGWRIARRRTTGCWYTTRRALLVGEELDALFEQLDGDPVGGLLAVPLADTLKARTRAIE